MMDEDIGPLSSIENYVRIVGQSAVMPRKASVLHIGSGILADCRYHFPSSVSA